MKEEFDSIVVGAGQAGPFLAVRLAEAGERVALVEKRALGGTCVNDGCTPTKTLVASARAAWLARNAAAYGVDIGGPITVDMKRVKARMDAVVGESRTSLETWIGGTKGIELVKGHARFEGPHTVRVDGGRLLTGKRVFVNVGAHPVVPQLPGLESGPYLTSTSILELDHLPEHLIVLGGGYISLELAQIYRRLGAEVTVVEPGPRLLSRDDADVSQEIRTFLELEGVKVRVSTKATGVEHAGGRVALLTEQGRIEGSHLLVATGRAPNTGDLGAEAAGLALDARGYIVVDDQLRTNVPDVWALGDCNGHGAFTHTSYNDFEIVAANLLDGDTRRLGDRLPIFGLYTDPPLGRVGMTEAEARKSGRRVLVGKRPMTRVARARERGETHGFIKILVDGDTKEILGAAILGVEGDEVVHSLATVMYAKAPYTVLSRAVLAHPTVSELVPTTLQSLVPLT